MKNSTSTVKSYALREGADLVGIASVDILNDLAPEEYRPSDFLPDAKSIVVMGVHFINGVIDQMPRSRLEYTCNYHEMSDFLNILAFKVARFLEREGYRSYTVSYFPRYQLQSIEEALDLTKIPKTFSDRHAAVEAGLGEIGLNNLLVTPQYGARIRVISIITNAPLTHDKRFEGKICHGKRCGYKCVKHCPVHAIEKDGSIDKQKCANYLKSLSGLACGMCLAACPKATK